METVVKTIYIEQDIDRNTHIIEFHAKHKQFKTAISNGTMNINGLKVLRDFLSEIIKKHSENT